MRREDGSRHYSGINYAAPGGNRPLPLDVWVPDASAPPFLLVHGVKDWLVPYAQSEQLAAALTAAGVSIELVPIEDAEHIQRLR
jgi:acetyl esterase/lipase